LAKSKTAPREVNAPYCRGAEGESRREPSSGRFTAVYYKAAGRPHLILHERSKSDDFDLLADAFQAAVAKARELGWIV